MVDKKDIIMGEYRSDDKEFNLKNCKLEMASSENEDYLKDVKEIDYIELLKTDYIKSLKKEGLL